MIEDPDLDRRAAGGPIRFEASVGGRSRVPRVVGAVAVVAMAVLVAKPWDLLPGAESAPRVAEAVPRSAGAAGKHQGSGVTAAQSAAKAAATEKAVESICLDPGTWRTATIEQWHADQTVRVWRAVDPRPATGPTDPAIDVVPAVGETVPAIGFCAPAVGPDRPSGLATVDAWRLDGGVATPIELRLMAPIGAVSAMGALFAPPLDAGASWPSGFYVFRHTLLSSNLARWFAVEVRTNGPVPRPTRQPPSPVMQPGGGQGAFFLP
jgi:hypothetical protein